MVYFDVFFFFLVFIGIFNFTGWFFFLVLQSIIGGGTPDKCISDGLFCPVFFIVGFLYAL